MRYVKKPKYRLDKTRLNISKDREITPQDIYKEMLTEKIKKRKR